MPQIVIIDDDSSERRSLTEAVAAKCQDADVIPYEGDTPLEEGASYEKHIGQWLDTLLLNDTIGLIACDKELGRYANLRGLSANPVSAAALQRAIPFCQYSRQPEPGTREFARFNRLRQWSSEQITLEGLEVEDWALQVESLYRGFESLRTQYGQMDKADLTPASALSQILEHPECESRIALYGAGDQGFLREIMTYVDTEEGNMDELYSRMPRILGNWLFLSILRFPGILVNATAAASYLNIADDDFGNPSLRACFQDALYRGPYHDHSLGPWWWRDDLDAIVYESEAEDGRAYAIGQGHADIRECLDPHTQERAGYYCMLMQEPVSSKNSRGDISWFPSGADLARIRKDKFEKITALIGSY